MNITPDILLSKTDFTKPDEVVLDFIQLAKIILKETEYTPKDVLHFLVPYSTLKFHPHKNYIYLLGEVVHINEIEKITINKCTARIVTKSIRNLTPVCVWDLEWKNSKWRICDIKSQRGAKRYYSLFSYETEKIDEI